MNPGTIWLGVTVTFILIQIGTSRVNVLCLSFGAFIAAVSTVFVHSYLIQAVIFAIVSITVLPVVRPLADKLSRKKGAQV